MREIVVVLVKLPEEPLTVTEAATGIAVLDTDNVRTLLVVAGFDPKTALTPFGKPDAFRVTLPLNPFRGLMVMVVEPEVPWTRVKLAGDAERVKFGCVVEAGQLVTKLAALTVPMPVAKSQPVVVPKAGW